MASSLATHQFAGANAQLKCVPRLLSDANTGWTPTRARSQLMGLRQLQHSMYHHCAAQGLTLLSVRCVGADVYLRTMEAYLPLTGR